MIRFSLRCAREHKFEGWFAGNEDYDRQRAEGLIACPVCGTAQVEKMLMTPNIARSGKSEAKAEIEAETAADKSAAAGLAQAGPAAAAEAEGGAEHAEGAGAEGAASVDKAAELRRLLLVQAMQKSKLEVLHRLQKLARKMRESADNVGDKFPEEARKIHFGEAEERPIYGTAKPEEVEELLEDGVEVLLLPRLPEDNN